MPKRLVLPDPHLAALDLGTEGELRPDQLIARLCGWQWRNVNRRQMLALGIGAGAIEHRIAAGRLHPRHRGVYVGGSPGLTVNGEWIAAVLACSVGTMLSCRSGAELRGFLRPGWPIHVTAPGKPHPREGICVHRSRAPMGRDLEIYSRIPTTSVPRLFVDLAATEPEGTVQRAFTEADRQGKIEMGALHAACSPANGRRGVGHLLSLVDEALYPEFTRSEGEEPSSSSARRTASRVRA